MCVKYNVKLMLVRGYGHLTLTFKIDGCLYGNKIQNRHRKKKVIY